MAYDSDTGIVRERAVNGHEDTRVIREHLPSLSIAIRSVSLQVSQIKSKLAYAVNSLEMKHNDMEKIQQ
ncbi:hypothetical protein Tco_1551768, partial [Tanacetum coccineum]